METLTYFRVFFDGDSYTDLDIEEGAKVVALWTNYIEGNVKRTIFDFNDIDGEHTYIDPARIVFIGISTPEGRREDNIRTAKLNKIRETIQEESSWD
jgi:hypothetical protein